jgi:ribose-phosphate pyrophosphokinase
MKAGFSREGRALLFALDREGSFGEAVARALGTGLCDHEERAFEDGEHKARPLASVRGRDVYVIGSLHGDAKRSVNDRLARLLFFAGALRDASAGRVTVVAPYLAYMRKDRKSQRRDPVTSRYVAALLEAMRVDRVVTLDVHNEAAFQNGFRCATENLEAAGILALAVAPRLEGRRAVVVSPDAGGIKRAERFRLRLAAMLGREVGSAFVEKHRSEGRLGGGAFVGDVRGAAAVIVDDLVSAGHTIDVAARACREQGADSVIAAASHGVFAGEADAVLSASPIDRIVVTDTLPPFRIASEAVRARLEVVSVAPLFAEAIRRLHEEGSIVELLDG